MSFRYFIVDSPRFFYGTNDPHHAKEMAQDPEKVVFDTHTYCIINSKLYSQQVAMHVEIEQNLHVVTGEHRG